ncbi:MULTISPECIES: DUF1294 domain-containing protein [unclassified Pseudoalteromonas]|uniref:DUF1294 domain-containing protein n=1 Tax=unclassified Pseudoalteromonas TaxID=194690 RepID=UPI000FFE8A86|nr:MULTISPECIES: DUF1294 domain-containing protein [unclassified Pseudoalteromonas]RXE87574.1 DUF1294 domain-containing protein [Pseudoalteromonas sp. A757]TMN38809.1 DUF1294 domain-containing protein [Pseudoalteromonas sp. S2755]
MSAVRLMHQQMGLFWGTGVWLGALCVSKLPWQAVISAVVLLVINLFIFALFWWDKRASTLAQSRIPERNLLLFGLLGLNIITPVAMYILRHKTIKPSFNFKLLMVLMMQTIVFGMLFIWLFI